MPGAVHRPASQGLASLPSGIKPITQRHTFSPLLPVTIRAGCQQCAQEEARTALVPPCAHHVVGECPEAEGTRRSPESWRFSWPASLSITTFREREREQERRRERERETGSILVPHHCDTVRRHAPNPRPSISTPSDVAAAAATASSRPSRRRRRESDRHGLFCGATILFPITNTRNVRGNPPGAPETTHTPRQGSQTPGPAYLSIAARSAYKCLFAFSFTAKE